MSKLKKIKQSEQTHKRCNIYLASDSPRRKKLLKQLLGNGFTTVKHVHMESNLKNISPRSLAEHHATSKALSASKRLIEGIVIGADTLVVYKDTILGKPATSGRAVRMLNFINGRNLKVITGVAVYDVFKNKLMKSSETTYVKIKELTHENIMDYVATKEPLDKAGAFAIQGRGASIVEWIKGDYYNVVGLPLKRLSKILIKYGIKLKAITPACPSG